MVRFLRSFFPHTGEEEGSYNIHHHRCSNPSCWLVQYPCVWYYTYSTWYLVVLHSFRDYLASAQLMFLPESCCLQIFGESTLSGFAEFEICSVGKSSVRGIRILVPVHTQNTRSIVVQVQVLQVPVLRRFCAIPII